MKHETTKDFIPHPRSGQTYRASLDFALCMVVGDLVRQVTSLTEATRAIHAGLDALLRESGRNARVSDDPVHVPHLALATLRLHAELSATATRLELTYRYLQRARALLPSEIGDRDTDPGHLLDSSEVTFED